MTGETQTAPPHGAMAAGTTEKSSAFGSVTSVWLAAVA
jgi:hypothetical protein